MSAAERKPGRLDDPSRKYVDIIERIEYVRNYMGLNKTKFSGEIGMKPQTYNNFIGSQGSKPNIELIHGIVNRFQVNPYWLLYGSGDVFADPELLTELGSTAGAGRAKGVAEGEAGVQKDSPVMKELKSSLDALEPVIQEAETRIREVEHSQVPLMNGLINVLTKYISVDPVGATREIKGLVNRLEARLKRIG